MKSVSFFNGLWCFLGDFFQGCYQVEISLHIIPLLHLKIKQLSKLEMQLVISTVTEVAVYSESQLQSFQGYGHIFPFLVFTSFKISCLLPVKLIFKNRGHLNFKWNYTENLPVTLKNRFFCLTFFFI